MSNNPNRHSEYDFRGHMSHIFQSNNLSQSEVDDFKERLNVVVNAYEQLQLTEVGQELESYGEYTGDRRFLDVERDMDDTNQIEAITDRDDGHTWLSNWFDFELPEGMPDSYKKADISTMEDAKGTYYEVYVPFVAKRGIEDISERHMNLMNNLFENELESSTVLEGTELDKFSELRPKQLLEPKPITDVLQNK